MKINDCDVDGYELLAEFYQSWAKDDLDDEDWPSYGYIETMRPYWWYLMGELPPDANFTVRKHCSAEHINGYDVISSSDLVLERPGYESRRVYAYALRPLNPDRGEGGLMVFDSILSFDPPEWGNWMPALKGFRDE